VLLRTVAGGVQFRLRYMGVIRLSVTKNYQRRGEFQAKVLGGGAKLKPMYLAEVRLSVA